MTEVASNHYPPWYKHRWPWLLMLGPFIVVIGCAVTIYLTIQSNIDTQKVFKAQNMGLKVERHKDDVPVFLEPEERKFDKSLLDKKDQSNAS